MKGVGNVDKQPSKKEQGYLSLETLKEDCCFLVFRNFIGVNQFSGLVNPKISKVKELLPDEHSSGKAHANKLKAKASLCVKDTNGKYEVEHVEITFLNDQDRQLFVKAFNQVVNQQGKKE